MNGKGANNVMEVLLAPLFAIYLMIVYSAPPEPEPPAVTDTIVLLPDKDGNVGEVTVTSAAGQQTLDTAYATVDVKEGGTLDTRTESQDSVNDRFGTLLTAKPPEPRSFIVNFETGSSDELTSASNRTITEMQAFLRDRPAPEITVIGHTDRVGSDEDNDALSRARAETVRRLIEATGVEALKLEATGRGEREPVIATADKVAEPRNRRVEISIR